MDASFRKAAEERCAKLDLPASVHFHYWDNLKWVYTYLQSKHQSEVRGLVEALENVAHCEAPIMCANCMYEARQALSAFREQQGNGG